MILAVSFHVREPFLPDIFILISFILFLLGSISLNKDHKIKGVHLLIIGNSIAILWYVINFFIPGILLPMSPTPEDLEFTLIYGTILAGLIPDLVLLLSLGILPLIVFFMNRTSSAIFFIALGAIAQIVSIGLSIDPSNQLLSVITLTFTTISMACFAYYGYNLRKYFLILFALLFFVAHVLLLL